MPRASRHSIEQDQTAVRARVRRHHEGTNFAAVEAQELSPCQPKRMCERGSHGEIGVDELWHVDDRDVGDLPCRQHLPSEVVLSVMLPADNPGTAFLWSKLQRSVLFVGVRQIIWAALEQGEFALGIATVQANGEAPPPDPELMTSSSPSS